MKNQLSFLFQPPSFASSDPEKKLQAWFLVYSVRGLLIGLPLLFVVWLFSENPFDPFHLLTESILLVLMAMMFGLWKFVQRGHVALPGAILVISLWLALAYVAWIADGVRDLALPAQFIIILMAGLILGWRSSILTAVSSAVYIYILTVLQRNAVLHPTLQPFQEYARDLASVLMLTAAITVLIAWSIRKILEESRLSEERFRNAFDNAPIGMAIVGLDEQILQVNRALCSILGYSREQLTCTTVPEITHPEDRQLEEPLKKNLSGGDNATFSLIKRYLHADGHLVWGRWNVTLLFDTKGQALHYLGQFEDITEHKRTEDELQITYDILRAIVNVSPLAIDLIDSQQKIRLWSPAAEQLWGWQASEVLGKDISVILGDQFSEVKLQIEEELKGQSRLSLEARRPRKDGTLLDINLWVAPLPSHDGEIRGVVSFLADNTERKRIQSELEENRRRLAYLMAKSPSIIYSSRAWGDFGATFVSANVTKQLGYQPEEFTENANFWSERIHPEDTQRVFSELNRLFEYGTHSQEYRFRHQNGQYLWMRDELTLIRGDDGEPRELVGAWIDITDRKRAESERENLIRELTEKNSELERFTYTVSHDLKAPLITIAGFLGYLEQDAASRNVERLRTDTRRIHEAVQKMDRLLNELLELSRIGRIVNPPQWIPFEEIIKDALERTHGRLESKRVKVQVQSNLPAVFGDRQRLTEVLQNLVDNAAKFMGGQVEPQIEIGQVGQESGNPVFYVKDNGIGILPEYFERVFGLFNKLDARSEGTGIGLALVKRIIEFHGGRIWVESDPGNGATFLFTLRGSQNHTEAFEV